MFKALILAVLSYLLVPVLKPIFLGNRLANYEGKEIPTGLGFAFVIITTLFLIPHGLSNGNYYFTTALLFFTLLGLVDDFLGNTLVRGIKGHFSLANVTTGLLKAVLGILFSLAISWNFSQGLFELIIHSILLAAGANFLNLMDTAPGRAGKLFIILAFPLVFFSQGSPLLLLLGAVAGYLPWDLRQSVMMGDTGSNSLGATLGLGAALLLPKWLKIVLAFSLVILNLLAEKVSFSKYINSNRFLNFLDQLGR